MKIMYWSDYACPYCYIGETHLKKAIENLNLGDQVDIEMLAFELDPSASTTYTGATVDRFAKKYGLSLAGAQERIDGISQMGREAGLDFRYAETRYTCTFDAHRLTKLAQQKDAALAGRLEERFYRAYGNTAQYGGTSGGAFSDICCLQISRFTASKPSKSAIASVEKFTRQLTTLIAR